VTPREILEYWFADAESTGPEEIGKHFKRWFQGGTEIDEEIKSRFGEAVMLAARDQLAEWENTTEDALALIILFDQFTRNVYRGSARAFAYDKKALQITQKLIASGEDKNLPWPHRGFLYMPMQHSEDKEVQARGVEVYLGLMEDVPEELKKVVKGFADSAREHKAIIDKFGRFPHRNEVLGRESTDEELKYLAAGAKRFGQ
jgi:uncharacterized protein (DUF924 family)